MHAFVIKATICLVSGCIIYDFVCTSGEQQTENLHIGANCMPNQTLIMSWKASPSIWRPSDITVQCNNSTSTLVR